MLAIVFFCYHSLCMPTSFTLLSRPELSTYHQKHPWPLTQKCGQQFACIFQGAWISLFSFYPILPPPLLSPIPVKFPENTAGGHAPELSQALSQAEPASVRWPALGELTPGIWASLLGAVFWKLTLRSVRQGLSL